MLRCYFEQRPPSGVLIFQRWHYVRIYPEQVFTSRYEFCQNNLPFHRSSGKTKKKYMCVSGFPPRPTLFFHSDPKVFIGNTKNEILSKATYPTCGPLLLVLPLSLPYFLSVLKLLAENTSFHYIPQANNPSDVFLDNSRENNK